MTDAHRTTEALSLERIDELLDFFMPSSKIESEETCDEERDMIKALIHYKRLRSAPEPRGRLPLDWTAGDLENLREKLHSSSGSALLAGEAVPKQLKSEDRQFIRHTCTQAAQLIDDILRNGGSSGEPSAELRWDPISYADVERICLRVFQFGKDNNPVSRDCELQALRMKLGYTGAFATDPPKHSSGEPAGRQDQLLLSQAARLLRDYEGDAHAEDVPDVTRWLAVYDARYPETKGGHSPACSSVRFGQNECDCGFSVNGSDGAR